jgi:hypothetical protein
MEIDTSARIAPKVKRLTERIKKYYPEDITSWPTTIEQVDECSYAPIQEIVHKLINERHNGSIIPVQFDDIYWEALNRQDV